LAPNWAWRWARSAASSPATTPCCRCWRPRARTGRPFLRRLACLVVGLLRPPAGAGGGAGLAPHGAGAGLTQPCCSFLMLVARFLARFSSPPAARRMLPRTLTFLTCGRWLPLLENFRP
jgi:hypothetical protein